MTATLYPRQRADRLTQRPTVEASNGVSIEFDDTAVSGVSYAGRRAVAALIVVLVVAGVAVAGSALAGALVDIGGRPAVAATGAAGDAPGVRIHVAQAGDTLWSIADRYRGDVGHGRFVDALIDLNGGTVIQIGQAVRLP